jgi:serine phosphatase RsbU (regulator of sigma subunit)
MAYQMLRSISARLREANDAAIGDLREKNQRLSQAYAALQAAQDQLIEKERLEHELRLAREIQESMLPQTMPHLAGFECCARMVPAREVGGDFFDLFALDDDTLGIVIGDVCGKGIPAALYMAQTRSMIRAEAFRAASPAEALQMVNRQLLEMNSSGMYVTVVYGQLCRSTRRFVTARAGHEWPMLWDAHGAPIAYERGVGHPLGLLPEPAIDVQNITLPAGSTLLLYTDGATEAANPAGSFFGRDGLSATLKGASASAAPALCDALLQAVNAHTGLAPQADDITLVVVRAHSG